MAGLSRPAILCCGEAVADLVPATLADGSAGFRPVAGGAAVNTAIALARLDVPAGFVGGLSDDPMGRMLREQMEAAGVNLALAQRRAEPTTLALAHSLPDGTQFDLYDQGSAGRAFDRAPGVPETIRALVFGGISLIHDPAASAFEALAAQAADRLIWLDLNIRPGLVTDAASYRARLSRLMARADVVKLSDEDLHWWGEVPDVRPGQMLIISHGARGATARQGGTEITLPAPDVAVADTVGAGDVLNAGCLAWLWQAGRLDKPVTLDPSEIEAMLTHGTRAAALSVTRPGAAAPTREELLTCVP
ncbi:carbohydrate kinase family protein [Ruegeria aquimaris]|uniref:Carbohydrate kinase n=1 Tax=Ruegeria aquimaris TaxID=2984333 RepID=A0ABT3APG6_9RHOB|nr:carbohydrate kinase [Ruegeria sp. XHP0148]MCV2890575.1 carbohydrate kinase [Ruegeria sp. XHP0148]